MQYLSMSPLKGTKRPVVGAKEENTARCFYKGDNCGYDGDPALQQVRDAIIHMLDAWTGDKGRVPLEKLAAPLVDATLAAPKASPEAKVCYANLSCTVVMQLH